MFELLKEKKLWNFLRKKLSINYQQYEFGIRDLRSGIRNKPIPDSGVKRHPSRIPNLGSQIQRQVEFKILRGVKNNLLLNIFL